MPGAHFDPLECDREKVKAVLVRLEAVLIEMVSFEERGDSVFDSGDAFHGCKNSRASTTARAYVRRTDTTTVEEKVGASRVAGGVSGAGALPAWNQLLHRVETLSRFGEAEWFATLARIKWRPDVWRPAFFRKSRTELESR